MELLILLVCLLILSETTFLIYKKTGGLKKVSQDILVDTSVLIDGRILDVAKTGFISGNLIILKEVLLELQLLADGKDSEKRMRARAGLDTVSELERVINVNVEIIDSQIQSKKVDEILLNLAKKNKATILTLDYNLIKVAKAEKIKTLNINDLALAIRKDFTPGKKIKIKISEKGSNYGQGVGYMKDGTMVVVEKAANKVGKEISVELTKMHETSAGTIIFAKLV